VVRAGLGDRAQGCLERVQTETGAHAAP
jgi:hypothetical protein